MLRKPWWFASTLATVGMVGLAATSGVVALAVRFVAELTKPHQDYAEAEFAGILAHAWAVPDPEPEPPLELQRALHFHAPHGPRLRGDFWAQPHPAPTVVVCHGYRISRAKLRAVAALEYQHGCNVLTFDFRAHGESEGGLTSGGIAEIADLRAAIDLAAAQPETVPGGVLIHGFSMGAAVALMTLPHLHVAGVIADSPYARLDDILRRLVRWRLTTESSAWDPRLQRLRHVFPGVAWATVATSSALFRLRYHHELLARTDQRMRRLSPRQRQPACMTPLLLIHTTRDGMIPIDHARRIAAVARLTHIPLVTYFPESDVHCGGYGADPVTYTRILCDFVETYTPFTFARRAL
ncbi:MAG: alpha/beta fold hydrolase [Ktedonobacterales bacterium]|nr:alpha/beta fold hydrolase [Ktedonobacterales bacterium]